MYEKRRCSKEPRMVIDRKVSEMVSMLAKDC